MLNNEFQVFDPGEVHLGLWPAVIHDVARPDGRGIVTQVVQRSRNAVDDQRVAGRGIAAVDGNRAGEAGRVDRVIVVEIDGVAPRHSVDNHAGLVVELIGLLVIDSDQTRVADEDAAARPLRVVDGVVGGSGVDSHRQGRHVVLNRSEILELNRLRIAAAHDHVGALADVGADRVRIAVLCRAAGLRDDKGVETVARQGRIPNPLPTKS